MRNCHNREENTMKRTILALTFFTLTLPAFGQGVDPLVGTWKLNAAKTTGSAYKSLTAIFTAGEGHNLIANSDGVDNQGKQVHLVFLQTYDGMPHPTTGDPAVSDATAYTRLGNTINIVRYRQGKLVDVSQAVINTTNKTYTVSGEALTADGQLVPYVLVFEKQ
jgi:hypothetical protein